MMQLIPIWLVSVHFQSSEAEYKSCLKIYQYFKKSSTNLGLADCVELILFQIAYPLIGLVSDS